MTSPKLKSLQELAKLVRDFKKEGKKIVLCHGVFDLIHPGHIRYFESAKKHGDVLIVTIPQDKYVKKGPGLPVFPHDLRAEAVSSIHLVDFVAIIEAENPVDAIKKIRPDIFVRGADTKGKKGYNTQADALAAIEEAIKSIGGKVVFSEGTTFSSVGLINQYLEVYPPKTKEFIEGFKKKYSESFIINKLLTLKKLHILVIGDTIIDQYVYTDPMGKSSKEPITVHRYKSEETFAGGTLATANHVAALSDNITLASMLGEKNNFDSFIRKHLKPTMKTKFFIQKNGSTIVKRRFIDEFTKQKLFQITYLHDDVKIEKEEKQIVTYLKNELPKFDMVIVNDFGHGFLTKKIIRILCSRSKFLGLNVQANSANYGFNVVTKYPRADFVCIDEMELRLATHNRYGDIFSLMKRVYTKMHCSSILSTRGPYGAMIYSKQKGLTEVPALSIKVVDRVGAGDALFAITSPLVYSGWDPELVGFIGNIAGAIQISTIGNKTPIQFDDIVKFIGRLLK